MSYPVTNGQGNSAQTARTTGSHTNNTTTANSGVPRVDEAFALHVAGNPIAAAPRPTGLFAVSLDQRRKRVQDTLNTASEVLGSN